MPNDSPIESDRCEVNDLVGRIAPTIREELTSVFQRHRLGAVLTGVLPPSAMMRTRARLLRATGWKLGWGTVFAATPRLIGAGRLLDGLQVGQQVFVNIGAIWELNDRITIGDGVAIGPDVMMLTSSHHIGPSDHRAADLYTAPIVLGDGVWIGARSLVLPGVHIGSGALIAAHTVVRHDVPANSLFAGNPGRVVRMLDDDDHPAA